MDGSITGQQGNRNLDGNGIDVEPCHGIRGKIEVVIGVCLWRQYAAAGSHAEVETIESSAQVNEERVRDRSCKYPDVGSAVALQAIDTLRGKRVVVRHGSGAH